MATTETTAPRTQRLLAELTETMGRALVGQEAVLQQVLVALLCRGHVLIEGVPGVAKTLLVRALSHCLRLEFKRVQMTPDLMPSDIVGTNVFEPEQRLFRLRRGPIFTALLLADEINRAPAKTQAALLEAMQERQVSIDGVSYPLDGNFTVFATQNPIEYQGTYPLPEAEVDRFLLKVQMDYPEEAAEQALLQRVHQGFSDLDLAGAGLVPVAGAEDLEACRREIAAIAVQDPLLAYVANVVRATRRDPQLLLGASPRAGVMLLQAAKAVAGLRGRSFVTPDDVKDIAAPVLRHRLLLRPEADIEGVRAEQVVSGVLATVPVPR
jgi:MoxR-like ATPase